MERHRALWKLLLASGRVPSSIVEVAPLNVRVFAEPMTRRHPGCRYLSVDKWPRGNPHDQRDVGFADRFCDLCTLDGHLPWKADLLLMQHVLEEVPDYRAGLRAIRNVLQEDAAAYLEIPARADLLAHRSQPPDRFGNVWLFSEPQMRREMEELFASVTLVPYDEGGQKGAVFVCST
ncbi:MAG TPA: methyltransferase domain-containing protein [Thermoanaerobaculia bacterium]|nr:methyltransferase domain-containing protein [Thermoanaerobaculia bacterium]